MTTYQIHTLESAPADSKPVLQEIVKAFGFIPNIAGAMAESPVLTSSFIGVFTKAHSGTFNEAEVQILLLTNAVTNASTWAVAFHTFLASQQGVSESDVQAIREGRLPKHEKHAALSNVAKTLIEKRGHIPEELLTTFIGVGYTKAQVLELINVVAASTITNYVGSVTKPALESQFQQYAWHA